MAYDDRLAERIRDHLPDQPDRPVAERRMFGGLAFLVGGHMAVAASRQGGLMVRVGPADSGRLVDEPGASRMVMRKRELDGWLRITTEAVADDAALARWVLIGSEYAASLPPK